MFKNKNFLGSFGSPTFFGSYKNSKNINLANDTSDEACCPDDTVKCCDEKEGRGTKLSVYK